MTILQGGVPKCGNFWLYQIIQQILTSAGYDTTSFIERQPIYSIAKEWDLNFPGQARIDVLEITDLQYSYRISSVFRMPIEDLKSYVAQTPHVWTHSPVCKRSGEVFSLFDKKVYIIRDPRDRAISAARYYCSDYMLKYFPQEEKNPQVFLQKNFDRLMQEWVWHVWDHLRLSSTYNIHLCLYEGFLFNFQEELSRLLHYLEISLPQSEKAELERAMRFASLKKGHPKHLQRGEAGYWMEQLTDEQVERADSIAAPLMRHLGYPLERSGIMTYATELEHADYELLKEDILQSQMTLYPG